MEIIELTGENIDQYLSDCISLQRQLITSGKEPNSILLKKSAEDDHSFFIGLLVDDRIVGLGIVNQVVDPVYHTAFINNIVVDETQRGQGFFSLIMNVLEKKAKDWGTDKLELTCSRPDVQPLYEKRGYHERVTKVYQKDI